MRKVGATIVLLLMPAFAVAEPVTIAALGDSLTQGYGLPEEDGFVPRLEAWLEGEGAEAELINAGVSGDTTAGGLARVDWTLTPQVDAVIVALGGNDLLRGLEPSQARANLRGIVEAAQARNVDVLLVGMQAPGNFGAEYKADFDAIYPQVAQEYDTLLLDSFFVGLTEGDADPDLAGLRRWFQADGIHPNAEGVIRIVEGVGPKVLELIEVTREVPQN